MRDGICTIITLARRLYTKIIKVKTGSMAGRTFQKYPKLLSPYWDIYFARTFEIREIFERTFEIREIFARTFEIREIFARTFEIREIFARTFEIREIFARIFEIREIRENFRNSRNIRESSSSNIQFSLRREYFEGVELNIFFIFSFQSDNRTSSPFDETFSFQLFKLCLIGVMLQLSVLPVILLIL